MGADESIMGEWVQNSARVGYPEMDALLECIKKAQVNVVMPMNERDNEGSQVRAVRRATCLPGASGGCGGCGKQWRGAIAVSVIAHA